MSIKPKFGKGSLVSIYREEDGSTTISLKDKHDEVSKLRIIPSTDVNGIFIEVYDKQGNFDHRASFSYGVLLDDAEAAKDEFA